MNTTNKILLVALGAALIVSAFFVVKIGSFIELVDNKASGVVETKTYDLGDISRLEVGRSWKVILKQGTENKLTVTVDTALEKYIHISNKPNMLGLKSNKFLSDELCAVAVVSVDTLDIITVKNKGRLVSKGVYKSEKLRLNAQYLSAIEMDIDVDTLVGTIRHEAQVLLNGEVESLNIKVFRKAVLDARNLTVKLAKLSMNHRGIASIKVLDSLSATCKHRSKLEYHGAPLVQDIKTFDESQAVQVSSNN